MQVVVIGAGPAGLAAAYALTARGHQPVILEKSDGVGGICRTHDYRGYLVDLGGHRFFTKFDEVQELWEEVLGDDFLVRPRMSRILYGGKFFDYPLNAANALGNLGVRESALCMASFARARLKPGRTAESFEDWVSNRFGRRLFRAFFKTYTEKVWGISTEEIGAEWASQRIKDLDLAEAVLHALPGPLRRLRKDPGITSLIEEFYYPRRGPGQMYEAMAAKVVERGADLRYHTAATEVEIEDNRVVRVRARGPEGEVVFEPDHVLSSMPLTLLVRGLRPQVDAETLAAANSLTYRNLITVDLIIDKPELFPDTWIYVHEPALRVGRIQNFGNWSPFMVPDPNTSCLGLEYFCSDGDDLWSMDNDELVELGAREIEKTGLLGGGRVTDGTAFKVPKAYPVYKRGYEAALDRLQAAVDGLENLQVMGRYGMFKYNNSDHSILTALLAVENLFGAEHELWAVNTDTAYHEIRK